VYQSDPQNYIDVFLKKIDENKNKECSVYSGKLCANSIMA